jgi:hypothetical protein
MDVVTGKMMVKKGTGAASWWWLLVPFLAESDSGDARNPG